MVFRKTLDNICDYITVEAFQLCCTVHPGKITMPVLCKMCKQHAIGCADVIVIPGIPRSDPDMPLLDQAHLRTLASVELLLILFCMIMKLMSLPKRTAAMMWSGWHDAFSIAAAVTVTSQHNHIKERQCEYIIKFRVLFLYYQLVPGELDRSEKGMSTHYASTREE